MLGTPLAQADNVTIHGTLGMLEAQLVTKTLEPVGIVEVWNTAMDLNIVITPDPAYLLSKVYLYIDSEPAPPPVPDWLVEALEQYEVQLATLATAGDTEGYETLLADPTYQDLLAQYEALAIAADFGEWPYVEKFKKDLLTCYGLELKLADLQQLQWGQWGEPWLQKRLVTVAVRVELKSTDAVPVTFTAWTINQNVPIDLQRTSWGDNAYAFRYELQHPKHGTFVGPVHGLSYSTPTHSGIIGRRGRILVLSRGNRRPVDRQCLYRLGSGRPAHLPAGHLPRPGDHGPGGRQPGAPAPEPGR